MKSFHFLWHLELAIGMCAQTDDLLKTLQSTRMTFVEGKALGDSVVKLLRVMRVNDQFDLFHNKILGCNMSDVGDPALPRRRNSNNCIQMQRSVRLNGLTSASARFDHSEESNHCSQLYLECTDALVVRMKDRLDQKHCH